jgi:hypothetical protein
MVLILRPEDNKVISVSRHKVHCHEEAYAKYDPSKGGNPLESFAAALGNHQTGHETRS